MGFICNWFKKKEEGKPDWVTQSREKVADEEERAAETHIAVLAFYDDNPELEASYSQWWGDREWQEHWAQTHQEAAWYIRHSEGSK